MEVLRAADQQCRMEVSNLKHYNPVDVCERKEVYRMYGNAFYSKGCSKVWAYVSFTFCKTRVILCPIISNEGVCIGNHSERENKEWNVG